MKFFTAATILLAFIAAGAASSDPCAPECSTATNGIYAYPHPKNCDLWYQCNDVFAILQECPSGLHFNPTINVCDYPVSAGCLADPNYECGSVEVVPTEEPSETTKEPAQTITEEPVQKTTHEAEVEDCIPSCPSPEVLYPDPRDCTMYFHCADSIPYNKPCPPGQEYWAEMERCDWPQYAQCTADPNAPCVALTSEPKPIPSTAEPGTECVPDCPSTDAPFAHPQDCTKFFICAHDYVYIYNCPSGQEYWISMERCDYPKNAQCDFDVNSPCVTITNPPK